MYPRRATGKPAFLPEDNQNSALPFLVINSVPNLIIVPAGKANWLLVGFRNEVWFLPRRPIPVLGSHWIGRQVKIEESVVMSWEFENEESPGSAKVHLHVTGSHACRFRCFCSPGSRH